VHDEAEPTIRHDLPPFAAPPAFPAWASITHSSPRPIGGGATGASGCVAWPHVRPTSFRSAPSATICRRATNGSIAGAGAIGYASGAKPDSAIDKYMVAVDGMRGAPHTDARARRGADRRRVAERRP
jgi:hypothetical protein